MATTQMQSRTRSRRGFTMIELIATTTIVGIMMSIVVPRMRISETTEVQLAGMQLAQDIDLARTRALSTRNLARVVFTNVGQGSYAGYLDDNGDSTIAGSNAEMLALRGWQSRDLPVRVKYGRGTAPAVPGETGTGAITWSGSRAEFNSRGLVTPSGTGGAVYLTHVNKPAEVVAVVVAPSGSVRLWTYHNGAWK
jgi:prepilin-type N-terminal cleavage/methylation domain-containing protein